MNLYEFWKNMTKRKPRKMWSGGRLVSDRLAAEYLAKCRDDPIGYVSDEHHVRHYERCYRRYNYREF